MLLFTVCATIFAVYLLGDVPVLQLIVPAHWKIIKSAFRRPLNQKKYLQYVSEFRNSMSLPPGYDWLDQRSVPVYPLVYAPVSYAKSYNHGYCYES